MQWYAGSPQAPSSIQNQVQEQDQPSEKHQQSSNRETVFSSSSENSHININYLFNFINIKAANIM
jgi:hypothetical protein